MKNLFLGLMALVITLSFTSCSNDSMEVEQAPVASMLKSYKLSRNAQGNYFINHNVADGVNSESVKNLNSKVNEIYLFEDGSNKGTFSNEVEVEENILKIGVFQENSDKKSVITVEDDNIRSLAAKGKNNLLNSYELISEDEDKDEGDKEYQLNFEVADGVNVSFGFNEHLGEHEIYLTANGNAQKRRFSRAYEKSEGEKLIITFVTQANASKGEGDTGRKPKIIIEE